VVKLPARLRDNFYRLALVEFANRTAVAVGKIPAVNDKNGIR